MLAVGTSQCYHLGNKQTKRYVAKSFREQLPGAQMHDTLLSQHITSRSPWDPNKQSLGIRETQIPHQMGWMESELSGSASARKTFSAGAEPQAAHSIFPSPHPDVFAMHQRDTREGSGLDTHQPSKGLRSSNTHVKPTLANIHHNNGPTSSPALFTRQPHQH